MSCRPTAGQYADECNPAAPYTGSKRAGCREHKEYACTALQYS